MLGNGKWQTDSSGRMLPVQFWINPAPPATSPNLTADEVEKAILAAMATWKAADPQVNFVYAGRSTSVPGGFNDVIGFASAYGAPGVTDGPAATNGNYTAFDVQLNASDTWVWNQCNPAQGTPCTPDGTIDVQGIATHELGHVLGLGHSPNASSDYELTMCGCSSGSYNGWSRYLDTLGLGDVLGLRALYPTSATMPPLYTP